MDELDTRIRSLEAERLRPVPPAPRHNGGLVVPDLPAITAALYAEPTRPRRRRDPDAGIRALQRAGDTYRTHTAQAPSTPCAQPGDGDT